MGKYLKIAVYLAVMCLAYIWISTVVKSCNKAKIADATEIETTDDIAVSDEFEDEFFEDEEGEFADEMGAGVVSEEQDPAIDYTEVDEIIEKTTPSAPKTSSAKTTDTTPPRKTYTSNASSGKYMLLAGSYLLEDNAKAMVRKLKKMGYPDAEVVVFNMSQYHSVCAGRYQDLSAARQESGSLKRKGVDNYVHTKQ